MERIIQLKEYEYHDLVTKATANEEEIAKMAKEIYNTYGQSTIKIDFTGRHYKGEISFHSSAHVYDKDNKYGFEMCKETESALVDFAAKSVSNCMTELYGKQINDMNHYNKLIKDVENRFNNFLIITLIGWLMAVAMFLAVILK